MGRPAAPLEAELTQDGGPLRAEEAGEDVVVEGGRSYLAVDEPRLYELVRNELFGYHILRLFVRSELFRLHAFTFGGRERPGVRAAPAGTAPISGSRDWEGR